MKKLLSGLLVLAFMFTVIAVPVAFAQPSGSLDASVTCQDVNDLLSRFICKTGAILNSIIPILITLGVVFFIWGVISYAIAKDEEAKTKGRSAMINGIIALAVIVSIWGLVNILTNFVGVSGNTTVPVPCIGIGCEELAS